MDSAHAADTTRVIKPGLERIAALLAELGAPHAGLRCVQVVGTNGKGSTCAYLGAILRAAGYKVGAFSSPALACARDAVAIDGEPVSEGDWESLAQCVGAAAEAVAARTGDAPSPFEVQCAMALEQFRRAACDICVIEAGMGGRSDATSIVQLEALIVARIGFDHMAYLGDTLEEIAAQKIGAVKPGVPVVSWPQEAAAMRVIEDVCAARGCPLTRPVFPRLAMQLPDAERLSRRFAYRDQRFETSMLGACQPQNASVAIEGARALRRRGWEIPDQALRDGIAAARCPGRFEVLSAEPLAIVDGAHNPQGVEVLAASLEELLRAFGRHGQQVSLVMGVLADKDYEAMIAPMLPFARSFIAYAPDSPRALPAADLAHAIRQQTASAVPVQEARDARAAAVLARAGLSSDGCMVAYGSLSSAAALRSAILSA